jgi:hypothetical protein
MRSEHEFIPAYDYPTSGRITVTDHLNPVCLTVSSDGSRATLSEGKCPGTDG